MNLNEFYEISGWFKYLMPTYYFDVLSNVFNEAKNKVFWKKTISKLKDAGIFEKNDMNVADDCTEFYFAINLAPENKSLPKKDREGLESSILVSTINKFENMLADNGLYDMIRFNYEKVDIESDEEGNGGVYGWVVACTFNEIHTTFWNKFYCYAYPLTIFVITLAIILIL